MDEGTILDPYSLHSDWTTDFSLLLNYTLGDMYAYLIVNEGYDHESLKAWWQDVDYTGMDMCKASKPKNHFSVVATL